MDKIKEVANLLGETKKKLSNFMRIKTEKGDMTLTQAIVIHHVYHKGRLKISDLGNILGLSNSTISGIVDRLEKNNLLKRIRSDSDRRVVYVEIVENFSKKHEIFGASFEKVLEDLLSDVDKDDIEKIYTGLSVLNYILDSKRNKGENLHD